MLLTCTWTHGKFWAQCTYSGGHSACQVAVVRGAVSLWPPRAQYFWAGCEEGMERAVHPLPLVEFVLPLQSAETFLSESTYGTSFQEQLVCLWKGPKAPKGAYFQSIPRKSYNNSVFSSLLRSGSSSHKNKQISWWAACIQHLAKLDQFAKCWCPFSWMT